MKRTLALIALAVGIAIFPVFFHFGSPDEELFQGTDSGAEAVVAQQAPDYEPWAQPLIGELAPEVESGIFAAQAALGAGVLGYALGVFRGRKQASERSAAAHGAST
ncbi:energy-coupling factor ABC transporter substrate-binding protein [Corynebacterium epidermidicanis]|uniref:Cobalt transport protein CbiN n=1 Tax=Corynebacterium epidermidicanis TaxID=1050174 RepID=A0A0G3GNV5_9CORY|nr:energy-coupling factor ABC transporter substrate-binding protein [Corynebacterium epidermidicanis]AKK02911.1 ABC-type cobalt transport system, periplasmic component [Corynebacterium epidermidicanis]